MNERERRKCKHDRGIVIKGEIAREKSEYIWFVYHVRSFLHLLKENYFSLSLLRHSDLDVSSQAPPRSISCLLNSLSFLHFWYFRFHVMYFKNWYAPPFTTYSLMHSTCTRVYVFHKIYLWNVYFKCALYLGHNSIALIKYIVTLAQSIFRYITT